MAGKTVNLEKEREKRAPKCPYCDGPKHPTDIMCPRVAGVTYHPDGAFEVAFDLEFFDKDEDD